MSNIVIDIDNVSKRYSLSHQRRPDSLKALFTGLARHGPREVANRSAEEFWALKDVSLQVREGECLALVGRNGSGKSTLLKILSRIIPPTCGKVTIYRRVASLLEVGTGFHPDLTGRENIFLNGAMLGCPEREIRRRFDAIVDFSGVERFLDMPVKHYSSGMYVRLAYAVAAHVDADILIIDEVLTIGDVEFQGTCLNHLTTSLASGKSAILVSHNIPLIQSLSSHVTWLHDGRIIETRPVGSDILERFVACHPA
jgi:lipopolysaccharide transport system ATP-binding protein